MSVAVKCPLRSNWTLTEKCDPGIMSAMLIYQRLTGHNVWGRSYFAAQLRRTGAAARIQAR
jgi:hypothetical protein